MRRPTLAEAILVATCGVALWFGGAPWAFALAVLLYGAERLLEGRKALSAMKAAHDLGLRGLSIASEAQLVDVVARLASMERRVRELEAPHIAQTMGRRG